MNPYESSKVIFSFFTIKPDNFEIRVHRNKA